MKSFVRHPKTTEGISEVCGFKLCSKGYDQDSVFRDGYSSPKTQPLLFHFCASVKYYRAPLQKRSLAPGKPTDEVIR